VWTVADTAVPVRAPAAGGRLDLRAGELVEARGQEAILATLDDNGELDSLPFMSEMLQYCGKYFTMYGQRGVTVERGSYRRSAGPPSGTSASLQRGLEASGDTCRTGRRTRAAL
jgi:hypothetical protein